MFNFFKISKFFLYASVFSVAIVSQATIFPFIIGKYAWFRTSIDLALIFFLIGIFNYQRQEGKNYIENLKKVLKSPIGIAVSIFVLFFILAGIFGVDPQNSFWSNFERGEGIFQIIHFYIFFLLLGTVFSEKKQWINFFNCSIVAAVIMIAYGILAGFGVNGFLGQQFGIPGFRFEGAIGNPAYLATYLIFIIFYILYIIFTEYRTKLVSFGALKMYLPLIISIGAFFGAATRGALIGLTAATFMFLTYLIFAGKKFRKIFVALAITGVFIFGVGIMFKNSSIIKKLPFSRIFDISFSAKTFQDRTVIWKMAWDGFKKRPLLGYGPENFIAVFNENFNPSYYDPFAPSSKEFLWFDRAHSIIFDYLSETGLFGFLSFISIFVVYYWQLFSKTRKNADLKNLDAEKRGKEKLPITDYRLPITNALLFSLPIAYLVQGLVLFDTLPVYINLFLFFAFAYFIFNQTQPVSVRAVKDNIKGITNKITYQAVSVGGIIVAALMIIYGSFLPYSKAEAYKSDMMKDHTANDFVDRFNSIYNNKSSIGNKEISLYISDNIKTLITNEQSQSEQTMRLFVNFIEPKIFPDDARQLLSMAGIYGTMWQRFHIEDDYKKAVDYYLKASEKAPNTPPVLYGMFSLYYMHGDRSNAENFGNSILKYWPQDDRINKFLNEINKK